MTSFKNYLKDNNGNFIGDKLEIAKTVRSAETYVRFQLITAPVLRHLYGDDVFDRFSEEEIKKLQGKQIVRNACIDVMRNLSENRENALEPIVSYALDYFIGDGILDPKTLFRFV
jgi:hypothetical protein